VRSFFFLHTYMDAQETQARQRDTRDIVWGAIVNLTGAAIRSLRLLLLFILGRLYGAEGIGLFLLAYATLDTLNKLVVMGLDQAVLTHVARRHASEDTDGVYKVIGQALLMSLTAGCIVSAGLAFLAPWLGHVFFKKPELGAALRMLAWTLPFWAVSAILLAATRALRVMHYEVITKATVEPSVILTLALGFYILGGGLSSLWVAVLVSAMVGSGTATYMFSRKFSLARLWRGLWISPGRWSLYRFAMQIGLVDLVSELLKRIDTFLIGRYLPVDMLGIYGIAQEWASTIKKIRQAFNPIFVPVIAAAHQKHDRAGMLHQYRSVTRWILILDACMLGAIILAGQTLMHLFGTEFGLGAPVAMMLTLALSIQGVLGVSELFLLIDKPWINLVNAIGALLTSIGLNLWLIPKYGMLGAALAVLSLQVMLNLTQLIEVAVLYHLQPLTRYHANAVMAFLVAVGVVWELYHTRGGTGGATALGAVVVFWLLYFALLALMGLAPEERRILTRWQGRLRSR
jgi:O-antigen/teichoic acid export membrane protein